MTDRLKVALVGCGRRGWFHLRMVLALEDEIELVAVCDRDAARLAKAAALAGGGIRTARRVAATIAGGPLDFAIVSTLQDGTLPIVRELLEARIPVLVEVPRPTSCPRSSG